MCVIIYKPAGEEISKHLIKNAYAHNSDGFGLMYSENGHVNVIKGMFPLDKILYLIKRHENKDVAIHLRRRTVGDVNKNNVHPFQVLNKEEHGLDLFLMHNGTFRSLNPTGGESDTVAFTQQLRRRIIDGDIDIYSPISIKALQDEIMSYNKVLLMTGKGEIITLNKNSGHQRGNVWFSNMYSLQPMSYQTVKIGNDYGTLDFNGYGMNLDTSSWF